MEDIFQGRLSIRLKVAAVVYLLLPLGLFLCNWLNILAAGLALFATGLSIYYCIRNWRSQGEKPPSVRVSVAGWIFLAIVAAAWVALSGIGGYGFQNGDMNWRNAVFHDLIDRPWPVTYAGHRMLVYYFSYWLPAALVGKAWGWQAANCALYIWTLAGVFLVFQMLLQLLRERAAVWVLPFVFFSGMDIVGRLLMGDGLPGATEHIEWWSGHFQFSSQTTQLFWVFNQALPAWIVTLLVLNETRVSNLVALYALAIPFAPFPSIGLLIVLLWKLGSARCEPIYLERHANRPIVARLRSLFSIQNMALPCAIVVVFGAFYTMNGGAKSHRLSINLKNILEVLRFYCLEIAVIAAPMYWFYRKQILFHAILVAFFLFPFYKPANTNDFCMRGSIPLLIVLFVYAIAFLRTKEVSWKPKAALVVILALGAATPFLEINRSMDALVHRRSLMLDELKTCHNGNKDGEKYFIAKDVGGKPFVKYLIPRAAADALRLGETPSPAR